MQNEYGVADKIAILQRIKELAEAGIDDLKRDRTTKTGFPDPKELNLSHFHIMLEAYEKLPTLYEIQRAEARKKHKHRFKVC